MCQSGSGTTGSGHCTAGLTAIEFDVGPMTSDRRTTHPCIAITSAKIGLPESVKPRRDVPLPLRAVLRLDVGVAAVVEDEARVGAGVDQLRAVEQFRRAQAQVEAHAQFTEKADALDELLVAAVTGRGGRAVEYLPDA